MEFRTEQMPVWEQWLQSLGDRGKRYAALVSPTFFMNLDPEMDLEAMKKAYIEALLSETALSARRNPQTGELSVMWKGNEEIILHELEQGGGTEFSLEEVQAKVSVH